MNSSRIIHIISDVHPRLLALKQAKSRTLRHPRRLLLRAALFCCCAGNSAFAATYYVSPSGSDSNSGLTPSEAFEDIQTAANITNPGDTVLVMAGTYAASQTLWHNAVVIITRSGTAAQPITFEAYPGALPIITTYNNPKVLDAVQINASYINFEGFEVVGNAQAVTLSQATSIAQAEENAYLQSVQENQANPNVPIDYPSDTSTNGNCITVNNVSHVMVAHNLVHDCSASGIAAQMSDYVTIKWNVVFNTSWWSVYDTSGINIHNMLNSDNKTGYKNFVSYNISHDNANTQPFFDPGGGAPTDGNGIIIDSNQVTNNGQPYLGRTLVIGNLLYNNGGSGAHAYLSMHVDMYTNTSYMNNNCPVQGSTCGDINDGEIFAARSTDVNIYNNIMYSPAGKWTYSNWENTDITEGHNLLFSANGEVLVGNNYQLNSTDILADPLFSDPAALDDTVASPEQDARDTARPSDARNYLQPIASSPTRGAGTDTLTDGATMKVNPIGMSGNVPSGLYIGTEATPN